MRLKRFFYPIFACLGISALGSACFTAAVVGTLAGTEPSLSFSAKALVTGRTHAFTLSGGREPFNVTASHGSVSGQTYTPPTLTDPTNEVLVTFTVTDTDGRSSTQELYVYRTGKLDRTFATEGVQTFDDGRGRIKEIQENSDGALWLLRNHTLIGSDVSAQLYDRTSNQFTNLPGGGTSLLLDGTGTGYYQDYILLKHPAGGFIMGSDHTGSGAGNIAIHKFTATGILDIGFGGTGYIHESSGATGGGLAVDSQGRIYAPTVATYFGDQIGVIRLLSDGTLDPSFGTSGVAMAAIGQGVTSIVPGHAWVAADGKVYITGHASDGGWKGVFLRFDENGTYDAAFGNTLVLRVGAASGRLDRITPLKSGKFLLSFTEIGASLGSVFRRNADGSVDTAFGTNGWSQTVSGTFPRVNEDSSGNLILCLQNATYWVARLLPNGNRDSTFAGDAHFGSGDYATSPADRCEAMWLDELDRIYFSGRAKDASAKGYLFRLWN